MTFDRKLEYQFGVTLAVQDAKLSEEVLRALPGFFEPKTKLGDPAGGELVVQEGAGARRLPTVVWGTGGVFRLALSPVRLDAFVDAAQYESVAERPLSLEAARDRMVPGLIRAAESLVASGFTIQRLAVILNGETSADATKTDALESIADYCFADRVLAAVREGEVIDLGARIDHGGAVDLGTGTPVSLHRIENLGTSLNYTGAQLTLTTRITLDVNTSPSRGTETIPLELFEAFYKTACDWIESRLEEVPR